MSLDVLLAALHQNPGDRLGWLAVADCLEEQDQPRRAELARALVQARGLPPCDQRRYLEANLLQLTASGVEPCVPTLPGPLGMTFVLVPPGNFIMGSVQQEEGFNDAQYPPHEVEITRPFYLATVPVTQGQFEAIMNQNPSSFNAKGNGWRTVRGQNTMNFPVDSVTWDEAASFCQRLTEADRGRVYRLPTEAEWEYACRAAGALTTPFSIGDGHNLSGEHANFDGRHPVGKGQKMDYLERPTPVGQYRPNPLGLYDIHGTIWEWCQDWYERDYYQRSPRVDPTGPDQGRERVLRGGAWFSYGKTCRSAQRHCDNPGTRLTYFGFRVAMHLSSENVS